MASRRFVQYRHNRHSIKVKYSNSNTSHTSFSSDRLLRLDYLPQSPSNKPNKSPVLYTRPKWPLNPAAKQTAPSNARQRADVPVARPANQTATSRLPSPPDVHYRGVPPPPPLRLRLGSAQFAGSKAPPGIGLSEVPRHLHRRAEAEVEAGGAAVARTATLPCMSLSHCQGRRRRCRRGRLVLVVVGVEVKDGRGERRGEAETRLDVWMIG